MSDFGDYDRFVASFTASNANPIIMTMIIAATEGAKC
jgi:hypothetical protein